MDKVIVMTSPGMAENAGRRARGPLPVSLRDKSAGQGVPHLTEGQVAGVQAQLSRSKRTALRSGRRWLPREAAADPAGAKPVLCPAARTARNTRGRTFNSGTAYPGRPGLCIRYTKGRADVKAGAAALCGGRPQAVPDAEPAGLVQQDQGGGDDDDPGHGSSLVGSDRHSPHVAYGACRC